MASYMFPNFLQDRVEYQRSRDHWAAVWAHVNPVRRTLDGWESPWMTVTSPELEEGNPIFTAVSSELRKGLRVIQSTPDQVAAPLLTWIDTFGGRITDPDSIVELVVVCVPTPSTVAKASRLIRDWVETGPSWTLTISAPEVSTTFDVNEFQALPATGLY